MDTVTSVLAREGATWTVDFPDRIQRWCPVFLGVPDPDALTRRVRDSPASAVRVGQGEVQAIRTMIRTLGDNADRVRRRPRPQDRPQLSDRERRAMAERLLHRVHRTRPVRRHDQLTHLLGWMCQDEGDDRGHQQLARHYYAHSWRLAYEAGEPELAATALRGLAVQSIGLGPRHRAEALALAERAMNHASQLDDPRARAYFESTFAEAAALDGDHTAATKALPPLQVHIERTAGAPPGESWASHFSIGRWAHASGMILAKTGDLTAAEGHLHQALEAYGLDRRRTRANVLGNLGEIHLRQGDLDGALIVWAEFLDCAEGVQSVRVRDAAEDMRIRLARYPHDTTARELSERAGRLLAV